MISLYLYLILAIGFFTIGIVGILIRRSWIHKILSIMFINSSACIIFLIFANSYRFDPEIDLFVLILIIISFFQFMAALIFFHKSDPVEDPKLNNPEML